MIVHGPSQAARRRTPRILVATRSSPIPGTDGAATYLLSVLSYLKENGYQIHVSWTAPPDLVPTRGWFSTPDVLAKVVSLSLRDALRLGSRHFDARVPWLPFKARLFHRIKVLLRSLGLRRESPAGTTVSTTQAVLEPPASQWDAACSEPEARFLDREIRRFKPDVVIANYCWMTSGLRSWTNQGRPIVTLAHDARHRACALVDGTFTEQWNAHMRSEQEREFLRSSRMVAAIQPEEARALQKLVPETTVITALPAALPQPIPAPTGATCAFVGSRNDSNRDGLLWFLREVWPTIKRTVPAAEFLVFGSVANTVDEIPNGVTLAGRFDEPETPYQRANVMIAPLLKGSGAKIKVIEAAAHGRPTVCTSVASDGLAVLDPVILVADRPEQFAGHVIELLTHPSKQADLGHRAIALVRERLNPEACYGPMLAGLQRMVPST